MEAEADRAGDYPLVGDEHLGGVTDERDDTLSVLRRHEDRPHWMGRLEQLGHGDEPFGDEQVVAFAAAACRRVGEVEEVGEALVVGVGDDHFASGKA